MLRKAFRHNSPVVKFLLICLAVGKIKEIRFSRALIRICDTGSGLLEDVTEHFNHPLLNVMTFEACIVNLTCAELQRFNM